MPACIRTTAQRVTEAFDGATDPSRRALYDVEYRTVGREDGIVRWVAAKGRGIFDERGECVRVLGTAIDITQRRAMQELLRLNEERLRTADRKKDEFLATLAHELRNPLAPIGNAAAVLKHPASPREQVTRFAEMIERQTKAMAVLLDDLLEVSRISTGKLLLKKKTVSVASLVESALEPVRPALETKKHALRIEMDGGEVLLDVDPIRVSQVLTNLLTNAIKYSNQGGVIVLRSRSSPAEVTLRSRRHRNRAVDRANPDDLRHVLAGGADHRSIRRRPRDRTRGRQGTRGDARRSTQRRQPGPGNGLPVHRDDAQRRGATGRRGVPK